jgi:uncharacterized membrane protein YphA (DoxX/SURF4 family)
MKLAPVGTQAVGTRSLPSDGLFAFGMAALRIFFGLVYLTNGLSKFVPAMAHTPFGFLIDSNGARGIIRADAHRNKVDLYRNLIDQVVLPNWAFFGPLVGATEVLVGLLLILGLLTPLAAILGALLSLHIQFATLFSNEWLFEYSVEWVPLLALAAFGAGRWYGLDGKLGWTGWGFRLRRR